MCNLLFTNELARRLAGTGVTANAIHPGLVRSTIMREAPAPLRWITYLVSASPEKAAETPVYWASAPEGEAITGQFLKGRKTIASPAYAQDPAVQRRLWERSEELIRR
jgi:NAD(P)-dependent dehydrogenase (short-subunit alcohol dehydrogenase family)